MARCATCGSIIFGGKKIGDRRYCNDKCVRAGQLLAVARDVPESLVQQQVWSVHQGACPKCGGSGPVDVHRSYRIWSALVLTRWVTNSQLSCRACGRKSQLTALLFSSVLGWWGLPWGLVITPVQMARNVKALIGSTAPDRPSPELENLVRIRLAQGMPPPGQGPQPLATGA